MSISAILPLKVSGRHYADNVARADILFSSLRAFAARDVFERIAIVVPHDELEAAKRYAAAWEDFPVEVVDEALHFKAFDNYRARHQIRPWHRQQIIKLAAPQMIATEYFLVLDPDVFATRRFDLDLLLPDGRALTYFQPRMREPRFWRASAGVLKQPAHLEREGMWWTPALLSRTLCLLLQERLESIYSETWMDVLLSRYTIDWTEYTLYWLNAEHEGLLQKFHQGPGAGMPNLHVDESVWFAGPKGRNFRQWSAKKHFAPDAKGIFAVVQSNTGTPVEAVAQKLEPYIPIKLQAYERHRSVGLKVAEFYSAAARRLLGILRGLMRRDGL